MSSPHINAKKVNTWFSTINTYLGFESTKLSRVLNRSLPKLEIRGAISLYLTSFYILYRWCLDNYCSSLCLRSPLLAFLDLLWFGVSGASVTAASWSPILATCKDNVCWLDDAFFLRVKNCNDTPSVHFILVSDEMVGIGYDMSDSLLCIRHPDRKLLPFFCTNIDLYRQ